MGDPIPCEGFRSMTAAVHAMCDRGMTDREIARRIGRPMKDVASMRCNPRATRDGGDLPGRIRIDIDRATVAALRPEAWARQVSVNDLIRRVLDVVAADGLVGAILDDGAGDA